MQRPRVDKNLYGNDVKRQQLHALSSQPGHYVKNRQAFFTGQWHLQYSTFDQGNFLFWVQLLSLILTFYLRTDRKSSDTVASPRNKRNHKMRHMINIATFKHLPDEIITDIEIHHSTIQYRVMTLWSTIS